eukprot:scaffold4777_cov120-Skeletonema_dohrnii-CCMP3373.AAC.12
MRIRTLAPPKISGDDFEHNLDGRYHSLPFMHLYPSPRVGLDFRMTDAYLLLPFASRSAATSEQ